MKQSDSGDFCVLYVEPDDEKSALFQKILAQKKPIVLMLAEQARVFQRPEDFAELKHIRRHLDMPILFVAADGERLVHLAGRHGFPVYLSMDALMKALKVGQVGKQRGVVRKTIPLGSGQHDSLPRKATASLNQSPPRSQEAAMPRRTIPLLAETWGAYEHSGHGFPSSDVPVGARFIAPMGNAAPTGNAAPPRTDPAPRNVAPTRPDPAPRHAVSTLDTLPDFDDVPTRPLLAEPLPQARPWMNRLAVGMIVLLIIALITAGLGYFLVASHSLPIGAPAMTNVVLGHVTFLSSNQLSETSSQGLNDKVLVDLNNLTSPASGKSYYAWLLGDKGQGDMRTILLGVLPVVNGHAQLLYAGDQNHTNLLNITSRFLVTEEDAGAAPLTPSPDYSTWRYYGEIAQTPINAPDNTQHFSYLDHLRHLLSSDPTLDELELPGGLNTWLYRNTSKILEWTGSTRDQWQETKDVNFVRRQTLRTLTYLDGVSFVSRDLPPNTGLNVNERLARIGLLDVDGPAQDPPGYLSHISKHLYGLLEANTATPALRTQVAAIVAALDNVKSWLIEVHHDAFQIMKMSNTQLSQPATLSLLNDMIDNATNAFSGQPDPVTGQMREGVTWIHDQIQSLATLNVQRITIAGGHNGIDPLQFVPNINVQRAKLYMVEEMYE
jgi:hypothetical protein